ncbi:hypothetical protein [Methylophaga sulfidovorans]|uniref:PEP-CTERM protein-sorting domain-containing protein n=1 Tax=Methylophaga sulfidovorans TaxID=45496 RepID=A0A1I4C252_9GAMM|nr:hypothetical protein [Methylophaga sulfidovorans]SFK74700.1 PEP-CTERM protein-sorting domain-containing protein [Methylophaga sulfidovorans]
MKLLGKKVLITLGFLIMAPLTANAATVHLDAKTNTSSNAVELNLTAGTYSISPFKDNTYTAWNAWGKVQGCSSDGTGCSKGWINNYSFTTPAGTTNIITSNTDRYETADLALLNAVGATFTLLTDATVKFFINDSQYGDNIGGMSLNVSAVPVPAAAFLFAPALLGFMGLRRRVQKTVA